MSIFSKNIMLYSFVYVASFYTHMTIAMSSASSADLTLISKERSSEEERIRNYMEGVFNIPTRELNFAQDRFNNQYVPGFIEKSLQNNDFANLFFPKNRPDNWMVISNSSGQRLSFTIGDVVTFCGVFNFMQNQNKPNVKMPAINITVEHLPIKALEQVMNRLDSIEEKYASVAEDKKNLAEAIQESKLLHQKINELEEKMSALEKNNDEKIVSTEKKYELLSQKLTESIKKYEEELTSCKAIQDFLFKKIEIIDVLSKSVCAFKTESIMNNLDLDKKIEELKTDFNLEFKKTKEKLKTDFNLEFKETKETKEKLEENFNLKWEEKYLQLRTSNWYMFYGIIFLACWNGYLSMAKKTVVIL